MNNNDNVRQSRHNLPATGPFVAKDETTIIRSTSIPRGRSVSKANRMSVKAPKSQGKILFVGPSIEGSDKEYIKVLSGTVNDHKPSFA